jgi:hypothetical protein
MPYKERTVLPEGDRLRDSPVMLDSEVTRYNLERFLISTQEKLSKGVLDEELGKVPQLRSSMRISVDWDYILRGMIPRLTGWILRDEHKHNVTKTMSITVPTTWWEMLKRDHFPEWWKRRWPVVEHALTKDYVFEEEVRVCPHANVAWREPDHIEFLTFQSNPPREQPGVLCPTCGKGRDTDGDGNCAYCGPKYQQLKED